jgi:hypothetical protein
MGIVTRILIDEDACETAEVLLEEERSNLKGIAQGGQIRFAHGSIALWRTVI